MELHSQLISIKDFVILILQWYRLDKLSEIKCDDFIFTLHQPFDDVIFHVSQNDSKACGKSHQFIERKKMSFSLSQKILFHG